jgi:hypothetical protein
MFWMTSDMIQVHSFQKSLLKVFGRSVSHLCSFLLISCGIESSTFLKNLIFYVVFIYFVVYLQPKALNEWAELAYA